MILGIGICALAGSATAGPVEQALAASLRDVEQGRCAEAESRLAGIGGLESRAQLLAGQCQIRAGRYPEALRKLEAIRGSRDLTTEQVGDVELFRGIALYHLERYSEASDALENAKGLTDEEAQYELYTGLILLRDGDNDRAAPALESAARLSPRLTEPVASYFAGLAWQGASERARARAAFERVIQIDGDGVWGKEAEKLLASTDLFPYFVRGSFGIERDDNVLLRGNVDEIGTNSLSGSGQRSWRGVWNIDGGVQLYQSDDAEWSAGATASFTGNAHFSLPELDLQYPTIGAYLSKRLGSQTIAQARYQFGFGWISEQPYLRTQFGEVSLEHTWTRAGTTLILADILSNELLFNPSNVTDSASPVPNPNGPCGVALAPGEIGCSPAGVNEVRERERDGVGYGAAIQHRYLMPIPSVIEEVIEEIEIASGYRFRYYDSRGEEWKYASHIFSGAIEIELPFDFSVLTRASYEYRDFANASTFADREVTGLEYALSSADRAEHEFIFEGEVEKDITENFSVSARYSYLDNESNRAAYDYDRHVVGGYLNFRFD